MSGRCRVRIPGVVEGQRCSLARGHSGHHRTEGGKTFPTLHGIEMEKFRGGYR